jgi:hypothetical protein
MELLVTLTISVILVSKAVASLTSFIGRGRFSGTAEALVQDL